MEELSGIELCRAAVRAVADWWRVDPNRVEWVDDGFDWWPGPLRVQVRAIAARDDMQMNACRLSIRTNVLRDVPLNSDAANMLTLIAKLAPMYGVTYAPLLVNASLGGEDPSPVSFNSSVYVEPETVSWLPHQLAMFALLQLVDAGAFAERWVASLGGAVDVDVKSGVERAFETDGVVNWIGGQLRQPEGATSRWRGSAEFAACVEKYGRCDRSFGNGDPTGLTLETPICVDSALITLVTDQPHPVYGPGLLATLQVRFEEAADQVRELAAICNLIESTRWTDVPQLGSWSPREVDAETARLSHAIFIPNAFYREGLATNVAIWQLGRARWVKNILWPNLQDCTMSEVLEGRFGTPKAN